MGNVGSIWTQALTGGRSQGAVNTSVPLAISALRALSTLASMELRSEEFSLESWISI